MLLLCLALVSVGELSSDKITQLNQILHSTNEYL